MERFRCLLDQYNLSTACGKEGPLKFVACANVSMKMCCLCGDGGKVKWRVDRYYILQMRRYSLVPSFAMAVSGTEFEKLKPIRNGMNAVTFRTD